MFYLTFYILFVFVRCDTVNTCTHIVILTLVKFTQNCKDALQFRFLVKNFYSYSPKHISPVIPVRRKVSGGALRYNRTSRNASSLCAFQHWLALPWLALPCTMIQLSACLHFCIYSHWQPKSTLSYYEAHYQFYKRDQKEIIFYSMHLFFVILLAIS